MNWLDYSIIFIYLFGLLGMGALLKNQQSSSKDYFLGGRSIAWPALGLSIMATQLSAVSFISAPAFVGLREGGGLIWLSYELALPIAMLLLLMFVLPFLHRTGVISIYDFLEKRFDVSTRLIISFVFQLSRAFATGIMVYAISIILQGTMGVAQWQSVLVIGLVTVVYSLQGGMKAVVYGDAIQMILIVFGALCCLGFGLHAIGGISGLLETVDPTRLQTIKFDSLGFNNDGFGLLPMIFGGVVLYCAYYGCDQSEAQRSLAAKDTHDLKKIVLMASLLRFPISLIYCFAGLCIGTLVLNTPELQAQIPSDKADWMVPIFIINYLPNGLIGLLLVAILAAAMSSVSSALNSLSAVTLSDINRLVNSASNHSKQIYHARLVGVLWGVIVLSLSFFAGDIAPTIIEAINKIGSVFYGPILACFVTGIWLSQVKSRHINLALAMSVTTNIILWLFVEQVFWFWWNAIGFASCIGTALVISKVQPLEKGESLSIDKRGIVNKRDTSILIGYFGIIVCVCLLINLLA